MKDQSLAQQLWNLLKDNKGYILAGGVAGLALYGTTIVLTGGTSTILGLLASVGLGIAGGVVFRQVAGARQEPVGEAQTTLVQEDQVIVLSTSAECIQQYDMNLENARLLVSLSQFYWVGTKTDWESMKRKLTNFSLLNTVPDEKMAQVWAVYTVKGPREQIPFSKGSMMVFLRRYAQQVPGEQGLLYTHPDMEGNIMEYGFKAE